MIHLVTGYAGYEHIQAEDDGAYNAAFFGDGQYVMGEGNQFEGSILDNNTVRILDGNGLMYGRHFRMQKNTYEDMTITTGTAGKNRADLICMTYEKNGNDGTEKAYLQVVKGTETEAEAVIPDFTDGNILEGAAFNQMPLYKVVIKGVVLSEIIPLFQVIPTYKELAEKYAAEFKTACTTHLGSLAVLDTLEEIEANTQEKQLAGALAVKELNEIVVSQNGALAKCSKEIASLNSSLPGFINTNDRLYEMDVFGKGSYNATQNCWAMIYMYHSSQQYMGAIIYIDEDVVASTASIDITSCGIFPLKKGQVFKWTEYTRGYLVVYPMW